MKDQVKIPAAAYITSLVFFLGGIYIAYKRKSGFWGYVGFALLGAIAGSAAAKTIVMVANKDAINTDLNKSLQEKKEQSQPIQNTGIAGGLKIKFKKHVQKPFS